MEVSSCSTQVQQRHEDELIKANSSPSRPAPLHEFVIASRLVKNRAYHRTLLLCRAALCLLFLTHRLRQLISCSFRAGVLGMAAVACELWFCSMFFLSIPAKWFMVERATYPDKLLSRYGELPAVDVFVTIADPTKEPPLIMVNTVLSVLALQYPSHKLACYVSDDGGSLLTLWALKEATSFAKSAWIPFCNKFSPYIHPRAPGPYFARKNSLEKANLHNFLNEWNCMKAEYQALESKIKSMSLAYCRSNKETLALLLTNLLTSTCFDGHKEIYATWALDYDAQKHSSHCEILLDKPLANTKMDLPHLVYLSREKNPEKKHHFKAGAMNSLLRVSGIMTNAPLILNLDCDMYVNDAKALLQAMCFFMQEKEKQDGDKIGFVQFPQCFEGVDEDDIYGTSMTAALEVFLKGMDGAQGPPYCGTGCIHKRESLYDKPPQSCTSQIVFDGKKLKDTFGCSQTLLLSVEDILSTSARKYIPSLVRESLLNESITLMDCTYEEKTSWGKEVGVMYGSVTEDLMTSMRIHNRGWKSISCTPYPLAFLGCAPSTSEDALTTRKRWSVGILEILFSAYSPLLIKHMSGLSIIQRLIYIYAYASILNCVFLFPYALLPALSILRQKPIYTKVVDPSIMILMGLFVCINIISIYENVMVGVVLRKWWNSEKMEYIVMVSSSLFAVYELLKKVLGLSETNFVITPKDQNTYIPTNENELENQMIRQAPQSFVVNGSLPIFIPPTILVIVNIIALIVATFRTFIVHSHPLISYPSQIEGICSLWVLLILQPFTKGLFLWAMGQSGPSALSSSIVLRASLIAGTLLLLA